MQNRTLSVWRQFLLELKLLEYTFRIEQTIILYFPMTAAHQESFCDTDRNEISTFAIKV